MTPVTRRTALGLAASALALPARAFDDEPVFLNGSGVAIDGYDPVAYFELEEAIRGEREYEFRGRDALWYFSSAEYRDMFRKAQARYTPEFGGYDAEGMARGFKRRSDPTLWVMVDRKVYLHYSIADQNRWAEDIRKNIKLGEANWKRLRKS